LQVCEEPEPRKSNDFTECPNEGCHFLYCQECWKDMGEKCLVCSAESDPDDVTEDDDDLIDSSSILND